MSILMHLVLIYNLENDRNKETGEWKNKSNPD